MKINKLVALMASASMLFTIGGGYNLNNVYASENTPTISREDPIGLLSSKTGAGTYVTGNKVTLNGTMVSGKRSGAGIRKTAHHIQRFPIILNTSSRQTGTQPTLPIRITA